MAPVPLSVIGPAPCTTTPPCRSRPARPRPDRQLLRHAGRQDHRHPLLAVVDVADRIGAHRVDRRLFGSGPGVTAGRKRRSPRASGKQKRNESRSYGDAPSRPPTKSTFCSWSQMPRRVAQDSPSIVTDSIGWRAPSGKLRVDLRAPSRRSRDRPSRPSGRLAPPSVLASPPPAAPPAPPVAPPAPPGRAARAAAPAVPPSRRRRRPCPPRRPYRPRRPRRRAPPVPAAPPVPPRPAAPPVPPRAARAAAPAVPPVPPVQPRRPRRPCRRRRQPRPPVPPRRQCHRDRPARPSAATACPVVAAAPLPRRPAATAACPPRPPAPAMPPPFHRGPRCRSSPPYPSSPRAARRPPRPWRRRAAARCRAGVQSQQIAVGATDEREQRDRRAPTKSPGDSVLAVRMAAIQTQDARHRTANQPRDAWRLIAISAIFSMKSGYACPPSSAAHARSSPSAR